MIEILKFELVNKGAFIAKFTVKMHKWGGLTIRECALFESGNKRWITLPSRTYEADGKKKYFSFLAYEDRELDEKFKASIMQSVDEYLLKNYKQQEVK